MKLNVGCGRNILPGWTNLDAQALPGVDVVFDLDRCAHDAMPFGADTFHEILVSHVIEHLVHPLAFMQALYRIATHDAQALFRVPYGSSDDAFEDPTHTRPYFLGSFGYFSQPAYWRADYGYRGDWATDKITLVVDAARQRDRTAAEILADVHSSRNVVKEMVAELRAVKPPRAARADLQESPKIVIQLD